MVTSENEKPLKASEEEILEAEAMPEPPLRASPTGRGMPKLNMLGSGLMQAVVVSVIVTVLLVFVALPMFGGGNFVTKNDFDTNVASVITSMNQITADNSKKQSEINAAIQNIPGTVTNAIDQKVSSLSSQISNIASQIESNASSVATLNADISSIEIMLDELSAKVTALQGKLDAMDVRLKAVEDDTGGTSTSVDAPAISSFTPTSGSAGTLITITGNQLINVTGVSVGGVSVTSIVKDSDTQIRVVVGSGATGKIVVSNAFGSATSVGTFTYTGSSTSQGDVTASIVGGSTLSLVSTGTTINISINNNTDKYLYAEQLGLTLQFLNPSSAVNTWGILLNGTPNSPSYSIVPGIVSYVWNAGEYIPPGSSKTVSITVTTSTLVIFPQTFQTTVIVTGFSSL